MLISNSLARQTHLSTKIKDRVQFLLSYTVLRINFDQIQQISRGSVVLLQGLLQSERVVTVRLMHDGMMSFDMVDHSVSSNGLLVRTRVKHSVYQLRFLRVY